MAIVFEDLSAVAGSGGASDSGTFDSGLNAHTAIIGTASGYNLQTPWFTAMEWSVGSQAMIQNLDHRTGTGNNEHYLYSLHIGTGGGSGQVNYTRDAIEYGPTLSGAAYSGVLNGSPFPKKTQVVTSNDITVTSIAADDEIISTGGQADSVAHTPTGTDHTEHFEISDDGRGMGGDATSDGTSHTVGWSAASLDGYSLSALVLEPAPPEADTGIVQRRRIEGY